MILGDVCTRACGFCAVAHGRPAALDTDEPARVGERRRATWTCATSSSRRSTATTSPDGGASIFAETIRADPRAAPVVPRSRCSSPTSRASEAPLRTVLDAGPDMLNHNTETVPRLYRMARPGGRYPRTLELLDRARTLRARTSRRSPASWSASARSGTRSSRRSPICAAVGCGILTIGQYLAPVGRAPARGALLPPGRVRDAEVDRARAWASATSSPVRWCGSSYHAHEQADAFDRAEDDRARLPALETTDPHEQTPCDDPAVGTVPGPPARRCCARCCSAAGSRSAAPRCTRCRRSAGSATWRSARRRCRSARCPRSSPTTSSSARTATTCTPSSRAATPAG